MEVARIDRRKNPPRRALAGYRWGEDGLWRRAIGQAGNQVTVLVRDRRGILVGTLKHTAHPGS
jgi:hypothetical protein